MNHIRRNLNQDGLENFFGCVRNIVQNQSSLITTHFRAGYTTKVVNNSINVHSPKSNCEPDCSTPLLSEVHKLFLKKKNVELVDELILTNYSEDVIIDTIDFDPKLSEIDLKDPNDSAMSQISVNVCSKVLQNLKCDECRASIETVSTSQISYPSELFNQNFKKIFCATNTMLPHICHEKYVRKQLTEMIEDTKVDGMGCLIHRDDVEKILKKQTVTLCILTFCKNVNDLLSGKNKLLAKHSNFIEDMAFSFKNSRKNIGKYSEKFE